ncbi:RNI-like protein [Dendrothele bispora CBS 962.96]|uniref:RNI-like protein n=1 Tax=Dendrothele bispora (strain CBS 962.96) TaxID=1314807 RepID=A0A4S8MYW9_DENBC|nr:RNI-like protein [Dendrothele bispora CBS 962.96]
MASRLQGAASFYEDMISVTDRLPVEDEFRRVTHLDLQRPTVSISDTDLARVFAASPHLEDVILSGTPAVTDRSVILLAENANNLQSINLSGCREVSDVAVLELASKSLPLQCIRLNGVVGLTDPSISAIAKSSPRLIELELSGLPLLSPLSVRDIWSYSRKLRTLRLAHCPLLSDKAFPSPIPASEEIVGEEKPLPPRPITWLTSLAPLILRHTAENLRILDLASCKITDEAVQGIVAHATRIQNLNLSGCSSLTDKSLESICALSHHLDVLLLAHVTNITDRGVVQLSRSCTNLRCVELAFCRNLTDMSVFELSGLQGLRRLSLVRVQKLTDIAVFSLAEHATALERLYVSYCDHFSLDAIHLLLKKLSRLQHLAATGVPSLKRKGVQRFSDEPPPDSDPDQRAAYRVFSGGNVDGLRKFLNKEEQRRREAEARNIPFRPRSDDKLDLY